MVDVNCLEKELSGVLEHYKPISLEEMDSVQLMNRTDTKYFFRANILTEILKRASKYYRVLEIKNHRQFLYFTTYFDTPDFILYQHHHNGKLNRYKIRQRRYEITGTEYFEVKFKTNKGWTLKSRIKNDTLEYLNDSTEMFLKQKTPYSISQLKKSITNGFVRITLVNNQLTERVTLDYGIDFSNYCGSIQFPKLGIIEVKQNPQSKPPMLLQIMKELNIRPDGISKYCLGVASLCPGVKVNSLKRYLFKINNL
jgi:hypothetical protein